MERRLAAILAADVVGYSRLMGNDEAGTLERLKALYRELLQPTIAERKGRVVKLMGDGLLAEFTSAVEAVQCAIEVQDRLRTRDTDLPGEQRIMLRIGVNLGDLIVEGTDIFGDGVNVAARLEGLSEPGGVCISGKVHDEIKNRVEAAFDDMGEQELKNIKEPVRAYRLGGAQAAAPAGAARKGVALPLPDKPSVVVLPFDNMSGDSEQEHFVDGITEDLITLLSHIRSFFVIARNTAFTYKRKAVDVSEVSRELGVRYVLEGSVRKSGDRMRVTAQLIDGTSGNHVWAERFDRKVVDIFDLQDELTLTIAAALEPELSSAERERALRRPVSDLGAWEQFQRGMWHIYRFTEADNQEAQKLFKAASAADERFGQAYAGQSYVHFSNVFFSWVEHRDTEIRLAIEMAHKAVACDKRDSFARWTLGRAYLLAREFAKAIDEFNVAIDLNPSYAQAYYNLGWTNFLVGNAHDTLENMDKAARLSPHDPLLFAIFSWRGIALLYLDQPQDAVTWARRSVQQPNCHEHAYATLAYCEWLAGNEDAARQASEAVLRIAPAYRAADYGKTFPMQDKVFLSKITEAMNLAGIPA